MGKGEISPALSVSSVSSVLPVSSVSSVLPVPSVSSEKFSFKLAETVNDCRPPTLPISTEMTISQYDYEVLLKRAAGNRETIADQLEECEEENANLCKINFKLRGELNEMHYSLDDKTKVVNSQAQQIREMSAKIKALETVKSTLVTVIFEHKANSTCSHGYRFFNEALNGIFEQPAVLEDSKGSYRK